MKMFFGKFVTITVCSFVFCLSPVWSKNSLSTQPRPVEKLNEELIGTWEGIVNTPWTTPYQIKLTFRADGTYSSEGGWTCLGPKLLLGQYCEPIKSPALYYGTDVDSVEKTYNIYETTNGNAEGTINIYFETDTVVEDEIKEMRIYEGEMTKKTYLNFKMYHLRRYGPLSFSLVKKI